MSKSGLRWIAGALLLAGLACGSDTPQMYSGHGTVTAVDAVTRKITLDHGDIPGLMPAMTMAFDVAPDVLLGDLAPGAQVDFELIHDGDAYTITSLERAVRAETPSR